LIYEDITKLNKPGYVDIISGGFPCQDISLAGGGKGIEGERSGLWNEMFKVVRDVRPKYVIIENSPALLYRGFEKILCNLSQIGYNAEWQCISNSDFGFPHKRERIYVIAYSCEVGYKSPVHQHRSVASIFKEWTPNTYYGFTMCKRIHNVPTSDVIRNDYGFQDWTHRIASIGESVNPMLANYLFECIKIYDNDTRG
jgi:DNA (cytosine-5)-methyltransferase 1